MACWHGRARREYLMLTSNPRSNISAFIGQGEIRIFFLIGSSKIDRRKSSELWRVRPWRPIERRFEIPRFVTQCARTIVAVLMRISSWMQLIARWQATRFSGSGDLASISSRRRAADSV